MSCVYTPRQALLHPHITSIVAELTVGPRLVVKAPYTMRHSCAREASVIQVSQDMEAFKGPCGCPMHEAK